MPRKENEKTQQAGTEQQDIQAEKACFGALDAQEKEWVLLPKQPEDTLNLAQEVFLNGVPYFIARGVAVEVPKDIAALLKDAKLIETGWSAKG